MNDDVKDLIRAACAARANSYSPYSHFRVGAALRGKSGKVYLGTNVENASFGLSICAERSAVCQAVAAGEREFTAVAICADGPEPTPPCGACRQVLLEFGAELPVYFAGERGADGPVVASTTGELLPHAFVTFKLPEEDGPR